MTAHRTIALPFVIVATASLALVIGLNMSRLSVAFAFLPLILVFGLAAVWTLLSAVRGQRWPLATLIFLSIMIMATVFRSREHRGDIDLVSFLKFSIYFIAFLIGSFALVRTHRSFLRPPGIYMALYGLSAAVTVFVSPTPIFTLGAVFGLFAWMLVSVAISERLSEKEILLILLSSLAVYVIASWFMFIFFPALGIDSNSRFTGLAGRPTNAGLMAVLYLVVLFSYYAGGYGFSGKYSSFIKALLALTAVLSIAMLTLTQARGGMVALLCVPLVIFLQRKRSLPVAILALGTVVFAIALVPDPIQLFEEFLIRISRSGSLREITTLTGRTRLWAFLLDRIMDSPFIGVGYAAARSVLPVEYILPYGKVLNTGHNFLLHSLYEIGIIGTLFLLLIVMHSIQKFFREPSIFRDSTLVVVLVTGILEAGISASTNIVVFIWFLSIFCGKTKGHQQTFVGRATPEVQIAGDGEFVSASADTHHA